VAALIAAAAAWSGCESSPGTDLPPPSNMGTGGGIGGGRNFDAGGGAGDLRISVVSPKNMEVIKGGTSPEVRARVLSLRPGSNDPSSDPVDPTSIQVSLRQLSDNMLLASGPLFGPLANNEFAAPFDLSKVATGDYQLIVSGATQSGARGTAMVPVRVDAGPTITIVSPKELGSYKGGLTVQVLIDSGSFGPTMNVEASIGLAPIALNPGSAPNLYESAVEFLKLSLDGEQILKVSASNSAGTRTHASVRFNVDNKGPVFSLTEPKEGTVVGGIIRVRARLADPSGVLGNSIIAVIGNRKDVNFKVELKPDTEPGVYSALFDTARLTSCRPPPDQSLCIVFPNLSFRASDLAGNEAVVAYDIGVDNHPPIVDLFPPPTTRVARFDQLSKKLVCSHAFDPLGDYRMLGDMPDDLCAVPQVFDLRARIEDAGNRADGLKHSPISLVDQSTVAVYVLGETSQPLVVDVDGDGACDMVNPKLVPTTKPAAQSNEVLAIRLAPVPPKGSADFTPDLSLDMEPNRSLWPGCSPGTVTLAPRRLCGSEPLSVVIGYPASRGPDPAIWSLEPITDGEPWCVGSQFDSYANEIPEGWACIAAVAADRLGNVASSEPLRVWIQRRGLPNGPSCPAPPPTAPPPPNCTGTYNRQTGELTGGTCKGRTFPRHEVLNEGALPEGPGAMGMGM
jgi:hypothetical protein